MILCMTTANVGEIGDAFAANHPMTSGDGFDAHVRACPRKLGAEPNTTRVSAPWPPMPPPAMNGQIRHAGCPNSRFFFPYHAYAVFLPK
jgi:hypothetical protein